MDNHLSDFQIEANELLDEAENDLLDLEKSSNFEQKYNTVFRAFHSLKGAAGMFELRTLESHMHQLESLFVNFKGKKELVNDKLVNYFLSAIDASRQILRNENPQFQHLSIDNFQDVTPKSNVSTDKLDAIKQRVDQKSRGVIFVVDDEEMLVKIIKSFLEPEGYIIHTFTSPLALIEKVKEITPDLILSDYKMPGMNGLDMAKKVFAIKEDVPVCFISAYTTKETMMEAIDQGIYSFLEKPINEAQLITVCRNAIARSRTINLLAQSLNHLLYNYSEFSDYLNSLNKNGLVENYRQEVINLLEKKRELKVLLRKRS